MQSTRARVAIGLAALAVASGVPKFLAQLAAS